MKDLSAKQLRQAAGLKDRIDSLQRQLQQLLGTNGSAGGTAGGQVPKKRKMSAAAIAKIRKAQKERWAKIKAAKK